MPPISRFDPWRSSRCTCPPKLTFNPYTGCDYACVYCYASSYIPLFFSCRPKEDLIRSLRREAAKLKGEIVSIANSSDPYPRMEAEVGLMRECMSILSQHDICCLAMENGMKFGVCRENLSQLNTAACDGSWLLLAKSR